MSSNISSNYILTNYETSKSERTNSEILSSATAASVSLTFLSLTGSDYHNRTIRIDNTSGVSKEYLFDNTNTLGSSGAISGGSIVVQVHGSNASSDIAQQVLLAIASENGHDDSVSVSRSDNVLSLTQSVSGIAGNTEVDTDVDVFSMEVSNSSFFAGGADIVYKDLVVSPFKISTKSSNNIRGQTTTSRYKVFLGEEKT